MAVIHISEAEAAHNLPALLAKVREGQEIRIRSGSETFAIVSKEGSRLAKPRMASEILDAMERDGSKATLDIGFAEDVMEAIRLHEHERPIDPWESF